jgi:hypothetical protein
VLPRFCLSDLKRGRLSLIPAFLVFQDLRRYKRGGRGFTGTPGG